MEVQKIYGLFKRSLVDKEGKMTDEILMTYHTDINEIYLFKGKHNYTDEDYSQIVEKFRLFYKKEITNYELFETLYDILFNL